MIEGFRRCGFLNSWSVPEVFRGKDGFVSKGDPNSIEGHINVWVNVHVPVEWVVPVDLAELKQETVDNL